MLTSDESVSTLRMASAARAAALARNEASLVNTSESPLALDRSALADERGVSWAVDAGASVRLAVAGVVRPERVGVKGAGVRARPLGVAGRLEPEGVAGRGIVACRLRASGAVQTLRRVHDEANGSVNTHPTT